QNRRRGRVQVLGDGAGRFAVQVVPPEELAATLPDPWQHSGEKEFPVDFLRKGLVGTRRARIFAAENHILETRAPEILSAGVADGADEVRTEIAYGAGVYEVRGENVMNEVLRVRSADTKLANGDLAEERGVLEIS